MRKNNTAIIFGGLFFSCNVMAGAGTLAPTVVPMVNGGQASIAISNTSPNLFTVPGDRIIAVNSLDGALTNNEQTASGGVVVTLRHYPHVQPDRQYHALLPVYFFLDTRWSGFMGKNKLADVCERLYLLVVYHAGRHAGFNQVPAGL